MKMNDQLIIVKDDDQTMAEAIQDLLHSWGYRTLLSLNNEEALRNLKEHPGATVLICNAGWNYGGLNLVRRVRAIDPDIWIIVMSGSTNARTECESLEAGANLFLEKAGSFWDALRMAMKVFPSLNKVGNSVAHLSAGA